MIDRAATPIAGLLTVGVAVAAYATLIEPRWFRLRHLTVPVMAPHAARPLRLLHFSDLHLAPGQDHRVNFVRRCLDTGPDLVICTGDSLGHADVIPDVVDLLTDVARGRLAVAVMGSNDFYGPVLKNPLRYFSGPSDTTPSNRPLDAPTLVRGMQAGGWHVIDNRRLALDTPGGTLDVAGLGDPHVHHDCPTAIDWTPPERPVALRLGIVHAPYRRVIDLFDRHGYDLVLAGHTHGGQVRLPGYGALVDNCDLPLSRARGLSRRQATGRPDAWLHVSAGVGASVYAPFRFACRPEATVLDLVPRRGL